MRISRPAVLVACRTWAPGGTPRALHPFGEVTGDHDVSSPTPGSSSPDILPFILWAWQWPRQSISSVVRGESSGRPVSWTMVDGFFRAAEADRRS